MGCQSPWQHSDHVACNQRRLGVIGADGGVAQGLVGMVVSSFSGSGLHVQHCTVLESCAAFFGGSPGKTPGKKPQMLEV